MLAKGRFTNGPRFEHFPNQAKFFAKGNADFYLLPVSAGNAPPYKLTITNIPKTALPANSYVVLPVTQSGTLAFPNSSTSFSRWAHNVNLGEGNLKGGAIAFIPKGTTSRRVIIMSVAYKTNDQDMHYSIPLLQTAARDAVIQSGVGAKITFPLDFVPENGDGFISALVRGVFAGARQLSQTLRNAKESPSQKLKVSFFVPYMDGEEYFTQIFSLVEGELQSNFATFYPNWNSG